MKEVLFKDKTRHLFFGMRDMEKLELMARKIEDDPLSLSNTGLVLEMMVLAFNSGARKAGDKEVLDKDTLADLFDDNMNIFRDTVDAVIKMKDDLVGHINKVPGEKKTKARQK